MERASSLRGNSEVPPVPADPWMSGTAFRRPALAEEAKLSTPDSTSVISGESVLIATSRNRMCTGRRGWASFKLNTHNGGWKAWLAPKHSRFGNLIMAHTLHPCLLCWSQSFHLHRIEQEVLSGSRITKNNPEPEEPLGCFRVQQSLAFCSAFLWKDQPKGAGKEMNTVVGPSQTDSACQDSLWVFVQPKTKSL